MSAGQEFRKFGETTSIRGIPRAVKNEDKVLVVIWWLAVLTCTAVLISQLTLLLIRYYKHEYTTTYKEGSTKPVFPDITLCNVFPLGVVGSRQSPNWTEYTNYMKNMSIIWPLESVHKLAPNITLDDYYDLFTYLRSPSGYFKSLDIVGDLTLQQASIGDSGLITDFNAFDWNWSPNNDFQWQQSVSVKWNPNYFQCYTLQVPSSQIKNVIGVTLVIYLEEHQPSFVESYSASPLQSTSTGIRLAVHGPGTAPDMTTGLSAGPGTETTVSVSPMERQRLEKPYHGCRRADQPLPYGASETYTADECYGLCLQEQVIEQCKCVASELSFTNSQLAAANNTVCGNQTSPVDGSLSTNLDGLLSLWCLNSLEYDVTSCNEQCDWPCFEYAYETSSTESNDWPHVAYQIAFYDKYIQDRTYADKFAAYGRIVEELKSGSISTDEAAIQLGQLDLIARNFLQVSVVLNQYVPTIVNETISISSEVLMANIGGQLSLWLGVTIATGVEFIELFYVLIKSHSIHRRRQLILNNVVTVTTSNPGGENSVKNVVAIK